MAKIILNDMKRLIMNENQFLNLVRNTLLFMDTDTSINPVTYYHCNERSYCYELYHKMRMKLYQYNNEHENYIRKNNILLTSELQKNLGNTRYPDFLLHNYDNFSHQIGVIEVKKDERSLPWRGPLEDDLEKLTNFMDDYGHYNFNTGIFLGVNMSLNLINRRLRRMNLNQYNQNIVIMIKNYNEQLVEFKLHEF